MLSDDFTHFKVSRPSLNFDPETSPECCLFAGMSVGAIIGVVIGFTFCILLIILIIVFSRKTHQKFPACCPTRRPSTPGVSTICCTPTDTNLQSMSMPDNLHALQFTQQQFIEDVCRDEISPHQRDGELFLPDDPPPPYDVVTQDNKDVKNNEYNSKDVDKKVVLSSDQSGQLRSGSKKKSRGANPARLSFHSEIQRLDFTGGSDTVNDEHIYEDPSTMLRCATLGRPRNRGPAFGSKQHSTSSANQDYPYSLQRRDNSFGTPHGLAPGRNRMFSIPSDESDGRSHEGPYHMTSLLASPDGEFRNQTPASYVPELVNHSGVNSYNSWLLPHADQNYPSTSTTQRASRIRLGTTAFRNKPDNSLNNRMSGEFLFNPLGRSSGQSNEAVDLSFQRFSPTVGMEQPDVVRQRNCPEYFQTDDIEMQVCLPVHDQSTVCLAREGEHKPKNKKSSRSRSSDAVSSLPRKPKRGTSQGRYDYDQDRISRNPSEVHPILTMNRSRGSLHSRSNAGQQGNPETAYPPGICHYQGSKSHRRNPRDYDVEYSGDVSQMNQILRSQRDGSSLVDPRCSRSFSASSNEQMLEGGSSDPRGVRVSSAYQRYIDQKQNAGSNELEFLNPTCV